MVSILSKGGEKVKFDKWEEITEELRAIGKLHGKMFSRICQDMTVDQGKILWILNHTETNQKDLAHRLGVTEATLSVRIKRLLENGLIERVVDENDKRVYHIVLSSKGKEKMDDIEKSLAHYQHVITQGITKEEYETVKGVIQKMKENIEREMNND